MDFIKKYKNIDLLIFANSMSNLFYSIAFPIVHTITIQSINSNILSMASLISCVIIACITKMWLSYSDELYKMFGYMLFIEAFLYALITILFVLGIASPLVYFMFDAICCALITRNVICGATRLKAFKYNGSEREKFDNKSALYCNITSIIGFGLSSIVTLPVCVAFIVMAIGIGIDNIFYYIVYIEERNK